MQFYNPVCYFALGNPDSITFVLVDDFDLLHHITHQLFPSQ